MSMSDVERIILGFDRLFNETGHTSNYPPYNIIKQDENVYVVEMAVAGFNRSELSIKLDQSKLLISGVKEKTNPANFIYKGLSNRSFTTKLQLTEFMEVTSATLEDGILKIVVERIIPEEKKPKMIDIL